MSGDLLLGIDIGTTNCKALVFDLAGRVQAHAAAPTPIDRPRAGWIEHDPAALWQTVAGLMRQALSVVPAGRVRGVAVASMAEAGLLLDAASQPLHPIISWNDSRSDPQFRAWHARFGAEQFRAVAGNPPSSIFGAFKLQWLREQRPAAYAAAARWLHVADYIAFRLCGAQATSPSLACRTMLFDLRQMRWSDALLAAAGLRADLLPRLVPAGAQLGRVRAGAAAETGLPAGVTVGCGGHDHSCGALAAGVAGEALVLDSMGTAEAAYMALGALPPLHGDVVGGTLGAHVVPGRFYISKGIRNAGSAVDWAARALGMADAAALMRAAAGAQPGAGGVLFLPRLAPADRGGWVGISADAGPAELARAVVEGLACEWRANLALIERSAGRRAEAIRVIGGGTRAALWLQIKADVLGRPLHVFDVPESVALGAALLGGVAAGIARDAAEASAGLALESRVVVPDPARAAFYEQHYRERYARLPGALAGL